MTSSKPYVYGPKKPEKTHSKFYLDGTDIPSMFFRKYIRILYGLLLITLWTINLIAQSQNENALIDPVLRYTLTGGTTDSIKKEAGTAHSEPVRYPIVIHGSPSAMNSIQYLLIRKYETFGTANLTAEEIYQISDYPGIRYIEYSPLHELQLDISRADIKADSVHAGIINNSSYTGRGVIIGLIDTGLDFFHDDFRHPDNPELSRVLRIWDLSLTPIEGESHPGMFEIGVEYTRDDIERDLKQETERLVRSRDSLGHGTHVAGIAGGGGIKELKYTGIAPDAEFVLVRFAGTSVSTQEIMHGIEYIFSVADMFDRPAVINISLGGHIGSHDGTAGHEKLIDNYADTPGRVVVVAAGNSGESENHTGEFVPPGVNSVYSLTVPREGRGDDYIMMYLWYQNADSIQLIIETPSGLRDTVTTGDDLFTAATDEGGIEIYTNPGFINEKGARLFSINLSDTLQGSNRIKAGDWRFIVSVLDGNPEFRYNTWIVSQSMITNRATLSPTAGRRFTVTMPGTAEKAITVGAYHTKLTWINKDGQLRSIRNAERNNIVHFSSGGPTRDLRIKPDITAPGRVVASTLSNDGSLSFVEHQKLQDDGYVISSGTSMSTAHITGLVALMLEANPLLKSTDILDILRQTSRTDEYATNLPNYDWGWGKPDALAAVGDAAIFVSERSIVPDVPTVLALRQNYPNPFNPSTTILFSVTERQHITLTVYDILGREVALLVNEELQASHHQVVFNAHHLPTGTYFYRLKAGSVIKTKRMILIK